MVVVVVVEEEAGALRELKWGLRRATSALIPAAEPRRWFMVELREREPLVG